MKGPQLLLPEMTPDEQAIFTCLTMMGLATSKDETDLANAVKTFMGKHWDKHTVIAAGFKMIGETGYVQLVDGMKLHTGN